MFRADKSRRLMILAWAGLVPTVLARGDAGGSAPAFEWSPEFVRRAVAAARADGDARRGAGVFAAAATGCSSCHRVGIEGGAVGPALTTVANCLTPEEIVEAVYWPSRTVKPEYRAVVLTLADGRVLQGIVREESAAAVALVAATGEVHVTGPP